MKYNSLVYPYFKICSYKKGTMGIIRHILLCIHVFVAIKKEQCEIFNVLVYH